MEGIFTELENENALRRYPFAAGCEYVEEQGADIPDGVFVDAAIYPVNPVGSVYLSSISEDGVFSVSDESGVIMSGQASGNLVELFDASSMSRHVGTLVASSKEALAELAGRGVERNYETSQTRFSASCVFPVVVDGVTSLNVGGVGPMCGSVSFLNSSSDGVRVSSGTSKDGRATLRFDVVPEISIPQDRSIKRIICVVDGHTPFRISRLDGMEAYNSVVLSLEGIDKDDVCAAAHREGSLEMADTCGCGSGGDGPCDTEMPSEEALPETYQRIEVYIPPDDTDTNGGTVDGADNAFYLVVPNQTGSSGNPISITMKDGIISPKTEDLKVTVKGGTSEINQSEFLDDITSKGIVIQVPGLSGGMV